MLETANVMFTDTVGSTSTLTRIGADAAEAQRHRHDTIVANVVSVFGGRVVKSTGDGALALLPSADHLVRAGSAVQEAAAAEGIPLRVGLSTRRCRVRARRLLRRSRRRGVAFVRASARPARSWSMPPPSWCAGVAGTLRSNGSPSSR